MKTKPRPPALNSALASYPELLRGVKRVMLDGQREIDEAWVRSYHETGRLIQTHILLNQHRANYGAHVYRDLAHDTGASERKLYECAQFYRCFPILRELAELGWNGCRLLCQLDNEARRNALAAQALRHHWPSTEIERRVRACNATPALAHGATDPNGDGAKSIPAVRPLTAKRGTPGLHLIVDRGAGPAVDLGFKLYRALSPDQTRRLKPGDIVRFGSDPATLLRAAEATKAELFTYTATVRRVVDGDTIVVALEVAPAVWLEEKLRLRGLDCPEMATPEGKAAKRFTDALLPVGTEITISTTKPDKYDRYLADVFVTPKSGAEVFLNNALLENGQAVRKEEWEFGDWGT